MICTVTRGNEDDVDDGGVGHEEQNEKEKRENGLTHIHATTFRLRLHERTSAHLCLRMLS